jgi:hypothetical protein
MSFWHKYDPYWLAVLEELQFGGVLHASMLEGIELHIEGHDASDIRATVYGGKFSSNLEDWQAKGSYRIENVGEDDAKSYDRQDRMFDTYENTVRNAMLQPVFDYSYDHQGRRSIRYLGARMINQHIGGYASTTFLAKALGDLGVPGGAVSVVESGLVVGTTLAAAMNPQWAIPAYIAYTMVGADILAGLYVQPRSYSYGWPGDLNVDLNSDISLSYFAAQ